MKEIPAMKPYFMINSASPNLYYNVFYFLAVVAGFLLLVWEGYRRKFNMIAWLLTISTTIVAFIIGCRFIGFSAADWKYILSMQPLLQATSRSVIGGILVVIPTICLVKYWLRFDNRMFDAFAFVLPAAMAIERVGCLLVGCCYGTRTHVAWAIQYGPRYKAFMEQTSDGILPAGAAESMPVHPTQLYEVLGCLVIILLLSKFAKVLRRGGSLFLLSFCLYGGLRFLLEFIRASHGEPGNEIITGLSKVQWILAAAVPLALACLLYRETRPAKVAQHTSPSPFRLLVLFSVLSATFILVNRWLDVLEKVSVVTVLLPLFALVIAYVFTLATAPRFRWASILLPVVALFMTNQTVLEEPSSENRVSYTTVSLGGMAGKTSLTDTYSVTHTSGGCDGTPVTSVTSTTNTSSENTYSAFSYGLSRSVQVGNSKFITFGISGFTGSHHETFTQDATNNPGIPDQHLSKVNTYSYSVVRPYFQYDNLRNFGLGVGLSIGNTRTFGVQPFNANGTWSELTAASVKNDVLPSVYFRVGGAKSFFFDVGYNTPFMTCFPVMPWQAGIGFRAGKGIVKLGTGAYTAFYIAPVIPIGKVFTLEPIIGLGGNGINFSRASTTMGSVSLHYKVGRKEVSTGHH